MLLFGCGKKDNNVSANDEEKIIASTIILDINPSIKIDLDKEDNVLYVTPLNEDAKDLVTDDMVDKKVTDTVNQISNNLIDKGYGEGDLVILVSSKDETKDNLVKETLTDSLKSKSIEAKVVSYVINVNDTHEGVSDGKASLIEDILKDNSNLTFEDLKNKSISELLDYEENSNTPVVNPTENTSTNTTTNTTTNTSTNTSTNTNTGSSSSTSAPSDSKDPAWCSFNKTKAAINYKYSTPNADTLKALKNHLGISSQIAAGGRGCTDSRSSYCMCTKQWIVTNDKRYVGIIDSYDGTVIEVTSE